MLRDLPSRAPLRALRLITVTVLAFLGAVAALAIAAIVAEAARATPPDQNRPRRLDPPALVPVPHRPLSSAGAVAPTPHRPSTGSTTMVEER